jgi:hypothetical protein
MSGEVAAWSSTFVPRPGRVSEAPPAERSVRRSKWADLFEECRRRPGEWRRIKEPLKKSTAAQIASDIRNVHRRDNKKTRLRGFKANDQWEAVWSNSPDDSNKENFYIWLRFIGVE